MRGRMIQVFLAILLVLTMQGRSSVATPNAETYKQNEQGLEKQFEPFLKAYQKADDKGMDESFAVFRLPKAKEWFGNYFSPEDAAKLSAAYDREISDAESSLIEDMNRADPGSRFRVRCEARGESAAGADSSGGGRFSPLRPVAGGAFLVGVRAGSSSRDYLVMWDF